MAYLVAPGFAVLMVGAVRFDVVPDYREREMREGFAKAILKPQFSLYKSKEH